MPVLPYSLRAIYRASGSRALLREFLYPLIRYFVSSILYPYPYPCLCQYLVECNSACA